jgi:hypothetical protein
MSHIKGEKKALNTNINVSYSTTPNVPIKLFVNIAYTVNVIRAVVKNIPNIYFRANEYCKSEK